jgi:hypothetical protein
MRAPIAIIPQSDADARLWNLTREVARLFSGLPWVLIGGQTVAILEAEHGLVAGRATVDVDALLDPKHPAWRGVAGSEDGAAALSILAE